MRISRDERGVSSPKLQFDTSSGFADAAALEAFLISRTNNLFSFDPIAHTLIENREVPLFTVNLSAGSSPIRFVYNPEAIAGAVPEPVTLSLTLSGLFVLAFLAWLRDGRTRPLSRFVLTKTSLRYNY
jgi:hypothetical protein